MGPPDRLSALDAGFLHQEGDASHMHIGGVARFSGPCPSLETFLAHLDRRLEALPRYRQKLAFGPLGPRWVDDPEFDLRFHVRHAALPSPAGEAELTSFVALLAGQRLDRARPLWEAWLLEAGPDSFALVFKSHHALVDGISNVDLATVLLDLEPESEPAAAATDDADAPAADHSDAPTAERAVAEPRARPASVPSAGELVRADAREVLGTGLGLAGRMFGAARHPVGTVRDAVDVAQGLSELARAARDPAPATPLNVPIGPHRRFALVHEPLENLRTIKDAFDCTVNDVLLTVVSGALRRFLIARDEPVDGLELRALVPVSVRADTGHGTLGNQLTLFRAPLPVYLADPVAALGVVREAMAELKASRQAVAASALVAAAELAPPGVLAQASRLPFSTRLFNLLVTNVPGPQVPLYLLGRRVVSLSPLPFLADHHGLAVAIISYDGAIEFGLLGDYDALPDLAVVAAGIETTLEELLAAAAAARAVRDLRRRRGAEGPGGDAAHPDAAHPAADGGAPAGGTPGVTGLAVPEARRGTSEVDRATEDRAGEDRPDLSQVPLMGSTVRRRSGPGSDMRAKRRERG